MDNFHLLGIKVSVTTMAKTLQCIEDWAGDSVGRYICVRDVPALMASRDDPTLVKVHDCADIVTPDGMPLVWMGRGLGFNIERVCGPDLMYEVCVERSGMGLRHFFYGGKEGVAEKLADSLKKRAPSLNVVGTYCPPFRPLTKDEDEEITQRILQSSADVVWVGISSPKQDLWMWEHRTQLTQTMLGVGAAFDFLSGEVKRAPLWMQRRGLESVYRLVSEPRRLWRRYLVLVPKFIVLLTLERSVGTLLRGALVGERR